MALGLSLGSGFSAPLGAQVVALSLEADRCAIAGALMGAPVSGCSAPNPLGRTTRKAGGYYVHFPFDSNQLDGKTQAHLDRLTELLQGPLSDLCIKLVGHADTVGAAGYNQILSERRARAVKLYLAGPGQITVGRMRSEGRGEREPLPDRPGADPLNRRVEILAKPAADGGCS
jgi:outer membrane protein OmpA-like peptidoglycan-associated protein